MILLKNAHLLPEYGFGEEKVFVAVEGARIASVGTKMPDKTPDETVDCKDNLLIPAFYNTHCHAAMTLFRGYGEDLPLQRWLEEKIYPAEDRLTARSVYVASKVAIAEMIRHGIVSFTDMYMVVEETAKAVLETGVKANLSRCLVSFAPGIRLQEDERFLESCALEREFHGAGDGRVQIDLALHAEYTNQEDYCRAVAEYAKERNLRMHIHLSETEREHRECIARHGKTPTRFFYDAGVLDQPTTAAHCVYVTDEDADLLREKGVTLSHNPVSNLKLGSGVMPLEKLLKNGNRIALGTDGVASNNRLDLLREMQTAALLQKGINRDAAAVPANELFPLLTKNGALSQGREDCGEIRVGNRADLVLIDRFALHNRPLFNDYSMLAYSAEGTDVLLTMADGRILYRFGSYTSIDEERLQAEFAEVLAHYFD